MMLPQSASWRAGPRIQTQPERLDVKAWADGLLSVKDGSQLKAIADEAESPLVLPVPVTPTPD